MALNPVRTPDGYNRKTGGGGGGTPTPKLLLGRVVDDPPAGYAVNGKGIRFQAGGNEIPISITGFGFELDDVNNRLELTPVPGPPPPAVPATIVPASFGYIAPSGPGAPALSQGLIDASGGADAVGFYVLTITTAAGKTGCVRVQVDPAN